MKSSLKTFLAGKNKYDDKYTAALLNSEWLSFAVEPRECFNTMGDDNWEDSVTSKGIWNVDVLDDGTAITYCTR